VFCWCNALHNLGIYSRNLSVYSQLSWKIKMEGYLVQEKKRGKPLRYQVAKRKNKQELE
jgi:hypothetical protein